MCLKPTVASESLPSLLAGFCRGARPWISVSRWKGLTRISRELLLGRDRQPADNEIPRHVSVALYAPWL